MGRLGEWENVKDVPKLACQKLLACFHYWVDLLTWNHERNRNETTTANRIQMSLSPQRQRRPHEPRLVAEPVAAGNAAPAFLQVQSDGRRLQLREGVQESRFCRAEERPG